MKRVESIYRYVLIFIIAVFISSFSLQKTQADIAPTPYILLYVEGIEVDYYYLDLLIDISDDDVDTTYNPNPLEDMTDEQLIEAQPLLDYEDPDGYQLGLLVGTKMGMAGSLIGELQDDGSYRHLFAYGIPVTFKIIILTSDGDILVSEVFNRTLLQSEMVYNLSDYSFQEDEVDRIEFDFVTITLTDEVPTEEIPYRETISAFILRVVITVIVELGIAYFIFNFKTRKSIEIIVGLNIITQFMLNIVIFTSWNIVDIVLLFIVLEVLVFLIEYVSYYLLFNEGTKRKILLYVLVANLVTFGLGLLIGI